MLFSSFVHDSQMEIGRGEYVYRRRLLSRFLRFKIAEKQCNAREVAESSARLYIIYIRIIYTYK